MKNGIILSLGVMLILFCGCEKEVKFSGYLDDYTVLHPDESWDDAWVYLSSRQSINKYNSFIIDPVVVHLRPGAESHTYDPQRVAEVVFYLREEFARQLNANGYGVVLEPCRDTMRVRAAITDVRKNCKSPFTRPLGVGIGGADFEMEGFDSITGERVIAVVDTKQGCAFNLCSGTSETGDAKAVARFWVSRFVDHLNRARCPKSCKCP